MDIVALLLLFAMILIWATGIMINYPRYARTICVVGCALWILGIGFLVAEARI
jgi:hypothetical protein